MKRILSITLVLMLTLSMLASCSKETGGNTPGASDAGAPPASPSAPAPSAENTAAASVPPVSAPVSESIETSPEKQEVRIIKASELITLEDASDLIGVEMQVYEELDKEEQFGGLRAVYESDDGGLSFTPTYMLQISFHQNEMLNEANLLDRQMKAQGGVSAYSDKLKEGLEALSDEDDPLKMIWINGIGDWASIMRFPIHTIDFAYGLYSFSITLTGQSTEVSRSKEEESMWKVEKLIETAFLAIEHLEAIIE